MTDRITKITNNQSVFSIWMGTFHSIFAKILRKEASTFGYTPFFTIYDNDDSIKLITRISMHPTYAPGVVLAFPVQSKNILNKTATQVAPGTTGFNP